MKSLFKIIIPALLVGFFIVACDDGDGGEDPEFPAETTLIEGSMHKFQIDHCDSVKNNLPQNPNNPFLNMEDGDCEEEDHSDFWVDRLLERDIDDVPPRPCDNDKNCYPIDINIIQVLGLPDEVIFVSIEQNGNVVGQTNGEIQELEDGRLLHQFEWGQPDLGEAEVFVSKSVGDNTISYSSFAVIEQ